MSQRLTDREKFLRTISEATFQKNVQRVMNGYGWRWYHAPDNKPTRGGFIQNTVAGFPDLMAVRGTRVLYAELKIQGPQGKVSEDQVEWITALRRAGQEVYIWRPGDMEEVKEILAPLDRPEGYLTGQILS